MNLNSIQINNFRNVKDVVVNFDDKQHALICGPNMSGKTNTLNAIYWAFTGVDLEGSNDNRANLNKITQDPIRVTLNFDDFTFARICKMEDDKPSVTIEIDGKEAKTIKFGEATLHSKLGLSDIILEQPSGFDIVKFLLNPLYFTQVSTKSLRSFFLWLANIDLNAISEKQNKVVKETLNKFKKVDPYQLGDSISKEIKKCSKIVDQCKGAILLFPSIKEEANNLIKEWSKNLAIAKADEASADKYALCVSKKLNDFYKSKMKIEVCLLEKGVGEDVFADVCYPILPKSKLPFDLGSYAEKTLVAAKFINEVSTTFNIRPLPLLVDNLESLDANTFKSFEELNVAYIGAIVK